MPDAVSCLIHDYCASQPTQFDEDGDVLLGSYYQFLDEDDYPVGGLIGPYTDTFAAERAAKRAFRLKDY